jgi:hypothetical protein
MKTMLPVSLTLIALDTAIFEPLSVCHGVWLSNVGIIMLVMFTWKQVRTLRITEN